MVIEVYASNKLNRLENHMKLSIYLKKEGLTQDEFAMKANVDPATISRLINKPYVCRLKTCTAITRASYGEVTWIDLTSIAMGEK